MNYTERAYTRMTLEQKERFEYIAYKNVMTPSEYLRNIIDSCYVDEESFNEWKNKIRNKRGEGNV